MSLVIDIDFANHAVSPKTHDTLPKFIPAPLFTFLYIQTSLLINKTSMFALIVRGNRATGINKQGKKVYVMTS
jgi:hypothetical protein